MAGPVEGCGRVVVDVAMGSHLLDHHHMAPGADILHRHGEGTVVGALHMGSEMGATCGIRGLVGGVRAEDILAGPEVLPEVDHTDPDVQEAADYIDLEEGGHRNRAAGGTEVAENPEGHRDTEVLFR